MDKLVHPMDLEMDKDGSLVLLEYGSGWYFNKNGGVFRLRPDDGNKPPTITVKPTDGIANSYSVDKAADPENGKITVTWYLTDGVTERELGSGSSVTLPEGKFQDVRAVAKDEKGALGFARISLDHSQDLPQLALEIEKPEMPKGFGETVKFKVTSASAPDTKLVVVRARYIPPTGHDAGGPEFSSEISEIAKTGLCLACHQVDSASVGPAYLNVSIRYRDQKDAAGYLKNKIQNGGGGVWGEVPMPPQIAIKPEDADKIIAAILGLSKGMSETKGTLDGAIQLTQKGDAQPGGAWEFSAEATGYSAARIRIAAQ